MSRADGQLRMAPKKHKVSLLTLIRSGLGRLSTLSFLLDLGKSDGLNAELMNISSFEFASVVASWHIAVNTPTDPHLGAKS